MIRASRVLLQKVPIRPNSVRIPNPATSNRSQSSKSGASPLGIAAILGGLALASYVFKPNHTPPLAAMDTFKPQVVVIFGIGDKSNVLKQAAPSLGFEFIDVNDDLTKMDALVKNGASRFFLEGFQTFKDLECKSETLVKPDLILDFGNKNENGSEKPPRVLSLSDSSTVDEISELLKKRNLL